MRLRVTVIMLTCDWLTLNLRQEGQPDFLHEAPLASSCGLFFFFFPKFT